VKQMKSDLGKSPYLSRKSDYDRLCKSVEISFLGITPPRKSKEIFVGFVDSVYTI
jgi:hypothetical protein